MSKQNSRFFEFDNFRADTEHKCLWYEAEIVPLTPRAFDTLRVLIENNGRVVDKETLLNQVWGDTFVEEAALKQNISTLRKKFESLQIGKQFIETIPRRGYRFVGEVREVFDEEEVYVVETRTKTHIVANQEIHLSDKTSAKSKINGKLIMTASAVLLAVSLASFFVFRYFFQPPLMSETKFRQFEISQITASGNVHKIAISPDGKYIALVEKKNDLQTLFLRQTDQSKNVEIIPPTKDDIIGITFAPNSEAIYYTAYPSAETNQVPRFGVLKKVPILGGTDTEILRDIDSPVSISPDGKKYSFIRNKIPERESVIILFDTTESKEKVIASRPLREKFNEDRIAWSPNSKYLATVANSSKDTTKPFEVIVYGIENGEQTVLSNENWSWMGQIAWLNDNSGIVLTAIKEDTPNFTDEVWIVSYPEGKLRKVTNGINGFYGLGMTSDSNSLVTVKSDEMVGLWSVSKTNPNETTLIVKNIKQGFGMDLNSENKIVYSTSQMGNADIWIMNSDGSQSKQLTNNAGADLSPTVSHDGRYIIFISNRTGTKNIWRMNLDGTKQIQLTNFQNVNSPSLSPDGDWVYFSGGGDSNTKLHLWKVPTNGGAVQKLNELITLLPQVSPDGKFIACYYPENGEQQNQMKPLKLSILSASDGTLIKQFDVFHKESQFDWTPDSKAISYIENVNGESRILTQPIAGGLPLKIFSAQGENIFSHRWSNDEKTLILEKGMIINDVILMRDVKPIQSE